MKKLFKNIRTKANEVAVKAVKFKERAKLVLSNNRGESSVSTAIVILISVVLGALLLAGLYMLFDEVILPTVTERVQEMFDYKG